MGAGMTNLIQYADFKEREHNEIVNQHEMRAVEIVAQAKYNLDLGYETKIQFAELVKEVSILGNLSSWSSNGIPAACDAKRFLEIMESKPENITSEMRVEAIGLFSAAYELLQQVI